MSAETKIIRSMTCEAIRGAILQLTRNNQWANRMHQLLREQERRAKHKISIVEYQPYIPTLK